MEELNGSDSWKVSLSLSVKEHDLFSFNESHNDLDFPLFLFIKVNEY